MVAVHPGEIIQRPDVLQHPSSPMHVARPAPRVLPSLCRLIGSSLASCPVRCRPTCGERECRCGSWSLAGIYCTSSTVGGGIGNSRRAVCGRRGACHEREARGRSRCSNIVLVGSIACVCRCSNKGETRSHRCLLGCCRVASGNECETRRWGCLRLRCSNRGIFGLDLGAGGRLLLRSTAATDEGETRSWCHVCLGLGACDGRLLSGTTASNEGERRGRRRHFRLGRCNRLHLFRCNCCKGNFRLDFGLLFRNSAADEAEARCRRGRRCSFAAVARRRWDLRLVHGGPCNTGLLCLLRSARHLRMRLRNSICIGGLWRR
mmetsp:Transcript_49228/g.139608  ORF Transcript_49228/g.139608 Transcript_49228/m.139608 type:complete len:319 (-) Transcript_49228:653-1609(-)